MYRVSYRRFLRNRFLLVAGLPIFISVNYMLGDIIAKKMFLNQLQVLETTIEFDIPAGDLIHEMQKERGLSTIFLVDNSDEFRERLLRQRGVTDSKLAILSDYLSSSQGETIKNILSDSALPVIEQLKQIVKIRDDVDNKTISHADVMNYYTEQNSQLIELILLSTNLYGNNKVAAHRTAFIAFLYEKDLAGQERAILGSVFTSGKFENKTAEKKFYSLVAKQIAYQDLALSLLTDKEYLFFYLKNKKQSSFLKETTRLRNLVLDDVINELIEILERKIRTTLAIHYLDLEMEFNQDGEIDEIIHQLQEELSGNEEILAQLSLIQTGVDTYKVLVKSNLSEKEKYKRVKSQEEKILAEVKNLKGMNFWNIAPAYWFDLMTQKINLMKEQESYLTQLILNKNKLEMRTAKKQLFIKMAIALTLSFVMLGFLFISLKGLKKTASN